MDYAKDIGVHGFPLFALLLDFIFNLIPFQTRHLLIVMLTGLFYLLVNLSIYFSIQAGLCRLHPFTPLSTGSQSLATSMHLLLSQLLESFIVWVNSSGTSAKRIKFCPITSLNCLPSSSTTKMLIKTNAYQQ